METKKMKTVYWFCLVLISCLVSANYAGAKEPVGWWKLDEGAGKIAFDSSGKNNNGTVEGDVKWVGGKIGGAIQFNGTDTRLMASRLPIENHSFTVTMWIYPIELKGNHTFFSQGRASANNKMHIRVGGPDAEYETPVNGFRFGFYENDLDTPADVVQVNKWYHVACIYDYENEVREVLLDGVQIAQDMDVSPFIDETGDIMIGAIMMNNNVNEYFNGILDDIRVYDEVLSRKEIQQVASSAVDSQYQGICNTIEEAKKLIKEKKFKQVVALVEKEISNYERFKQKNQDKSTFSYDVLACELNYLHGMASDAIGDKKNIIAEDFKKAAAIDILNDENMQGNSLLWLSQNVNKDYNNVVNPLLDNNSYYFKSIVAKSKAMISNGKAKDAIDFLEGNIAIYIQWQKEHQFDHVIVEDMLPEIYFQLARAKEVAKAPAKDIIDAYICVFNPSNKDYANERKEAYIWLIENDYLDEASEILKRYTTWNDDTRNRFNNTINQLSEYYEVEKDWESYQTFLDSLFLIMDNPIDWALRVKSYFVEEDGLFSKSYAAYLLEQKPEIKTQIDVREILDEIQTLKSEEKFVEAGKLYLNILQMCPNEDKQRYELDLCQCLFQGEKYEEINSRLNEFVNNHISTNRDVLGEALLIYGRTLMQLTEFDKARDVFWELMIEHPEIEESPEVSFIIGYCYMLQGMFDEAKEAFAVVIKDYPTSSYAEQAQSSLDRINIMTGDS